MKNLNINLDLVKRNIPLIIIGYFLGLIFLLSYIGFIFVLIVIISIILHQYLPRDDRNFLIRIFFIALTIRLILCISFYFLFIYLNSGGWVFGDEWGISARAWKISQFFKGLNQTWIEYPPGYVDYTVTALLPLHTYGTSGYTYWVAFLYYLFGYITLLPKVINSIVGASLGVIAYLISRELFDTRVARLSMILVTFFPSLVLWSILNLKDIIFIFLSMVSFYLFIKSQKSKNFIYLLILFIVILSELTIRDDISVIIPISIILTYILQLRKKHYNALLIFSFIGIVVIIFLNRAIFIKELRSRIGLLAYRHVGNVNTEGFAYKLLPEKYYLLDADLTSIPFIAILKMFFLGWIYFISVPFPWGIKSLNQLIALPQIILWYGLFVFSLIGLFICIRNKIKISLCLILYIFLMGSIIVLSSGNIGTTFRHRDILTPFFLIFSALAITKLFREQSLYIN